MKKLFCFILICAPLFLVSCWRNGSGDVQGVLVNKSEEGLLFTTGTLHLRTSDNSSSTIAVCSPWDEVKNMTVGQSYNINYYKRNWYYWSESCDRHMLGVMQSYSEIKF